MKKIRFNHMCIIMGILCNGGRKSHWRLKENEEHSSFIWQLLFVFCFVFVFPWVQQLGDSYIILYKQALASMFTLLPWYAPPHQYSYPLDSSCCDKLLFIEKDKIYAWKYKDFKKKSQRNFFLLKGVLHPWPIL